MPPFPEATSHVRRRCTGTPCSPKWERPLRQGAGVLGVGTRSTGPCRPGLRQPRSCRLQDLERAIPQESPLSSPPFLGLRAPARRGQWRIIPRGSSRHLLQARFGVASRIRHDGTSIASALLTPTTTRTPRSASASRSVPSAPRFRIGREAWCGSQWNVELRPTIRSCCSILDFSGLGIAGLRRSGQRP